MFLRLKDGNVESALIGVKKYYGWIYRNSDYIRGVKPKEFEPFFNSEIIQVLDPRYTVIGISTVRLKQWNPKIIDLRSIQLGCLLLIHKYSDDPIHQEQGLQYIFDMAGLGLEHVLCLTPREVYRMITGILVRHIKCNPVISR